MKVSEHLVDHQFLRLGTFRASAVVTEAKDDLTGAFNRLNCFPRGRTTSGASESRSSNVILAPGGGSSDKVVFENYDDKHYGYLRVIVTKQQLRME